MVLLDLDFLLSLCDDNGLDIGMQCFLMIEEVLVPNHIVCKLHRLGVVHMCLHYQPFSMIV